MLALLQVKNNKKWIFLNLFFKYYLLILFKNTHTHKKKKNRHTQRLLDSGFSWCCWCLFRCCCGWLGVSRNRPWCALLHPVSYAYVHIICYIYIYFIPSSMETLFKDHHHHWETTGLHNTETTCMIERVSPFSWLRDYPHNWENIRMIERPPS